MMGIEVKTIETGWRKGLRAIKMEVNETRMGWWNGLRAMKIAVKVTIKGYRKSLRGYKWRCMRSERDGGWIEGRFVWRRCRGLFGDRR